MSVFEITEEDFAEYDIDLTRPTLAVLPRPAPRPEPRTAPRTSSKPTRQIRRKTKKELETLRAQQAREAEQARIAEQARNLYLTELTAMNEAIDGLKGRMPEVVKLAKTNGATWEDIGDALGTSRQAACRTFNEKITV